jgi:myo-inositol-1(or 4)-monophosphatase
LVSREEDLQRIQSGLARAGRILADFSPGEVAHRLKAGGDPVTEADTAVNDALLAELPRSGEGWLSEETVDDAARLTKQRVWVVDPLDGTREFVEGIPEWCVSIGLVEAGRPVAGGIAIPSRELTILGSLETGVRANGSPATVRDLHSLDGVAVLASRSEVRRGEWQQFDAAPFSVTPMGSVAAKMGLVAAGLADATWTLVPKHEWDVAAGTALVSAAGGEVWTLDGSAPRFNNAKPLFRGLLAAPAGLAGPIKAYLREAIAAIVE